MTRALTTLGAMMILLALATSSPISAETTAADFTVRHVVETDVVEDGVAEQQVAEPGDVVTYLITIVNRSDDPLVDVVVEVAPDDVFASLAWIDQDGVGLVEGGGEPRLGRVLEVIEPGGEQPLRYQARLAPAIGAATGPAVNVVTVTGGSGTVEEPAEIPLGRTADLLMPTHRSTDSSTLVRPAEPVEYELAIENRATEKVTDVVVRVLFDPTIFAPVDIDEGNPRIVDGELRWSIESLDPGRSSTVRYEVAAVSQFPDDADPGPLLVVVEAGGSTATYENDVVELAASGEELEVTHRVETVVEDGLGPGESVDYVVEIANKDDGSPFEDVTITVVPDGDVFASVVALDPTTADGSPQWSFAQLDPQDTISVRYRATAKDGFPTATQVQNEVNVEVGDTSIKRESGPIELATQTGTLEVTHQAKTTERIGPSDAVTYTITITNRNSAANVEQIVVAVGLDDDVFASAEGIGVDSNDATDLTWTITRLGPEDPTRTLTYQAIARAAFAEGVEGARNDVTVSVAAAEEDVSVPSGTIALAVASSSDDEANAPPLEGPLLFTLIIVFLLVSFVSVSFLVIGRRTGLDAGSKEIGLNLFATVSLVSATLILAFGTTVGTEALSLLAAIAGYVLGRRFSSADERPIPPPVSGQPGPDGSPSPLVGAPAVAGAATSGLTSGAGAEPAPIGPVATGTYEWRAARERNRVGVLALLAVALLSPVLIVLSTVWLLDSTNDGVVSRSTYLSAGTVSLLMLVFICFLFYLYSDASGPGAVRALLGQHEPDRAEAVGETPDRASFTEPELGSDDPPPADDEE